MHFVAVEWLKGGKSMFWCFDSLLLANISSFFLDELQAAWLFFIHAFKKSWAKKNILKKKKSRTEGQRRCLSHLFGFLRFAKFTGTQALYQSNDENCPWPIAPYFCLWRYWNYFLSLNNIHNFNSYVKYVIIVVFRFAKFIWDSSIIAVQQ